MVRAPESKNNLLLKLTIKKDPELDYTKIFGSIRKHSRSATKVKEIEGNVIIEIEANDITALRASANSILRDLQVMGATKLQVA